MMIARYFPFTLWTSVVNHTILVAAIIGAITISARAQDLAQVALAKHNELRALHCVPALRWDAALAATAQASADRCVFQHSNNGLGENLAMGTTGAYPPESQVQSWYDEFKNYNFANPVFGMNTGHFTQVVWKSTTAVGCGVAHCQGQDLLVCNYSPPGNYTGQFQQNVPKLCNQQPARATFSLESPPATSFGFAEGNREVMTFIKCQKPSSAGYYCDVSLTAKNYNNVCLAACTTKFQTCLNAPPPMNYSELAPRQNGCQNSSWNACAATCAQ